MNSSSTRPDMLVTATEVSAVSHEGGVSHHDTGNAEEQSMNQKQTHGFIQGVSRDPRNVLGWKAWSILVSESPPLAVNGTKDSEPVLGDTNTAMHHDKSATALSQAKIYYNELVDSLD